MNLKLNLPIITLFTLIGLNQVESSPEHCSLDTIRDFAAKACSHLVNHMTKRDADLSDLGYNIETVKAVTRNHSPHHPVHHSYVKKLTHSSFPRGGYLLIHSPLSRYVYASNKNAINEGDNSMSNEIRTEDLREKRHFRNKHSKKVRRNAHSDPLYVTNCCPHLPNDSCGIHFCN